MEKSEARYDAHPLNVNTKPKAGDGPQPNVGPSLVEGVQPVSDPLGLTVAPKPGAPNRPPDATARRTGSPEKSQPPPAGKPGAAGTVNWTALADKIKECLRMEHYSYRTEQTYLAWIRRFVIFHGWRKPSTHDLHARAQ